MDRSMTQSPAARWRAVFPTICIVCLLVAGLSSFASAQTATPPAPAPDTSVSAPAQRAEVPAIKAERADSPDAVSILPKDLTPWGMFLAADIVVKAVMIGLAFA